MRDSAGVHYPWCLEVESEVLMILCPDQVAKSVLDIDLEDLADRGIKGLIVDLDNTLMGWDSEEMSAQVREWVAKARERGFSLCITSNALEERVRSVAHSLGIPAISNAVKPRKRPFKQALRLLGLAPEEAVVIGDQIFTDILGGNRVGVHTILIQPISKNELCTTKIMRRLERRVLAWLKRKGLLHGGRASAPGR